MHRGEKRVVREEISPQNQNLCVVWKRFVNAAAALWVSCVFFSEVAEFYVFQL